MKCTFILVAASFTLVSCTLVKPGDNRASGYALLSASRGGDPKRSGFQQLSGYVDDGTARYLNSGYWNRYGGIPYNSGGRPYYAEPGSLYRQGYFPNRPYISRYNSVGGSAFIPRTLAMNRYGRSFFAVDPARRGIIRNWRVWRGAGGPLEEFGPQYFEQHPSRSRFFDRVEELRNSGVVWPFSDGPFGLPYLDDSAYIGPGRGFPGGYPRWQPEVSPKPVDPVKPNVLTPIREVQPVHPPNFNNAPIVIPIPQRSGIPVLFQTKVDRVRTLGTPSEVEVIRPIIRVETPKHPDKQPWMDFTTDAERFRIVNEADYGSSQPVIGPMGRNRRPVTTPPAPWNSRVWPGYPGQPNWGYYGPREFNDQRYYGSGPRYVDPRMRYMNYHEDRGIDTSVLAGGPRVGLDPAEDDLIIDDEEE
ncbi:hypothetical protein K493DRAFT_301051 [Basidiobolus meristosporus CBS 931.73]|uniref:Uncharacterized protein n=1 Tax=Basidiobolus meristosporus CBS 931.73 TaxID=1314790 RepID=A0A1Y1YF31_9FUNG|nr:hypothetical protein K493DRAFT_301051 [Basidiobolus meristosporus CBS 931.73]|eukprot:ORX96204.1 hypothetical protein K493DRAFT_301051 [Basidiobolus meristosporus CBS 931.73]